VLLNTFFASNFEGERNGNMLKTIHELSTLYKEELTEKAISFSEKEFIDLLFENTN
jgi:hypothetical protein